MARTSWSTTRQRTISMRVLRCLFFFVPQASGLQMCLKIVQSKMMSGSNRQLQCSVGIGISLRDSTNLACTQPQNKTKKLTPETADDTTHTSQSRQTERLCEGVIGHLRSQTMTFACDWRTYCPRRDSRYSEINSLHSFADSRVFPSSFKHANIQ